VRPENPTIRLLATVTAALALLLAGCSDDPAVDDTAAIGDAVATSHGGRAPFDFPDEIPELLADVQPSVVSIDLVTEAGPGAGSGVIVRSDGLVVTNAHVVSVAEQVIVVLADGTRLEGTVEAADPFTDLAIVRVDRTGLPAATIAERYPTVGEPVVAVGNPLGFENTVTSGIVSGIQRSIPGSASQAGQALVDLVQTDAAISPGNSGGGLVDSTGEIIGINVAFIPPVSGAVNLGFAIPGPTVSDVVEELLEDGEVDHPFLGLQLSTVTPQITEQLDIDAAAGAAVLDVVADGPAAQAGLEPGDVVVEAAGRDIRDVGQLLTVLRRFEAGDELPLTVNRDGEELAGTVELGSRPVG
jgi:serine protease DegQ